METVCARADLSRPTLYKIESGNPAVTLGSYAQVLRVLGFERDLGLVAGDDVLGRSLQDEALPARRRAPRRRPEQGARAATQAAGKTGGTPGERGAGDGKGRR